MYTKLQIANMNASFGLIFQNKLEYDKHFGAVCRPEVKSLCVKKSRPMTGGGGGERKLISLLCSCRAAGAWLFLESFMSHTLMIASM